MLRNRPAFYLIVLTQTFSLIGSRLTAVGMGIWVFQTTGNTTPLLLTAFFNELPGMLGGSLVGVLIDRWDRRKVMILADSGQALGSLLLLASLVSGQFQVWHLYGVALLQGIFGIFQQPTQDAVVTLLIPDDRRDRANAIRQMSFPLAGVVAPAVAGMLYVWVGIAGIIVVDLTTFLIAVAAVTLIHVPRPPDSQESLAARGHWLREMLGGFHFLAARPALLLYVLYITLMNFMLNGPLELAIPYMILKTGSEQVAGGLLSLMSLGALLGGALVAVRGKVHRRLLAQLSVMLLCGLMFLIYGAATTPWLLGASILLLMIPLPIGGAMQVSVFQSKTPPDMQGRIFASLSQLGFLGSTTSFLLTGWLVDRYLEPAVGGPGWERWAALAGNAPGSGMGLLLFLTGLIILAATLVMIGIPAVRQLEATLPDYPTPETPSAILSVEPVEPN